MFICKICGLVYPSEPLKCLNDGYKDFEEIKEHIQSATVLIKFSDKQENLFPFLNLPLDIIELETGSRFYYGFSPSIRSFPIKLKLKDLFLKDELIFQNYDEINQQLGISVNVDKAQSPYSYYYKSKDKRDYEKIESNQIFLTCIPSDEGNYDELKIKNLSIKFLGIL